jgi:hypothetical protein
MPNARGQHRDCNRVAVVDALIPVCARGVVRSGARRLSVSPLSHARTPELTGRVERVGDRAALIDHLAVVRARAGGRALRPLPEVRPGGTRPRRAGRRCLRTGARLRQAALGSERQALAPPPARRPCYKRVSVVAARRARGARTGARATWLEVGAALGHLIFNPYRKQETCTRD